MILKLPGGRTILYSAITELLADDGYEPDGDDYSPGVYVRFVHTSGSYGHRAVYVTAAKGQTEHQLLEVLEHCICEQIPFDARDES